MEIHPKRLVVRFGLASLRILWALVRLRTLSRAHDRTSKRERFASASPLFYGIRRHPKAVRIVKDQGDPPFGGLKTGLIRSEAGYFRRKTASRPLLNSGDISLLKGGFFLEPLARENRESSCMMTLHRGIERCLKKPSMAWCEKALADFASKRLLS